MDLRPYQKELVSNFCEFAGNLIVCLPTGVGKTIISQKAALEAMRKFPNKFVVFLAPTVPLSSQQQDVFSNTGPEDPVVRTRVCVGGKRRESSWGQVAREVDVIFFTPQVFLDEVKDGRLKWKHVSLVIFDECHHAVKNHPYNLILRNYDMCEPRRKPRLLGLTASPSKTATPHNLRSFAGQFGAQIVSSSSDLEQYVHTPEAEIIELPHTPLSRLEKDVLALVPKTLSTVGTLSSNWIDTAREEYEQDILRELEENPVDSFSPSSNNVKGKSILEALDLLQLFGEASLSPELIERLKLKVPAHAPSPSGTTMSKSPSFLKLAECLKHCYESTPPGKPMLSIIFVTTRVSAKELMKQLTLLSKDPKRGFGWLKPTTFVGHRNKSDDLRMTQNDQKRILELFRQGIFYNTLIATSIAEEGIDVPNCNLVVRLETDVSNLTTISMIQSRGRARYPSSRYVIIASPKNVITARQALAQECSLKEALVQIVQEFVPMQKHLNSWAPSLSEELSDYDSDVEKEDEFEAFLTSITSKRALNFSSPPAKVSKVATNSHHIAVSLLSFWRQNHHNSKYADRVMFFNNFGMIGTSRRAIYSTERISGPDHMPLFETTITLSDLSFKATGPTKNDSKHNAAELAFRSLLMEANGGSMF